MANIEHAYNHWAEQYDTNENKTRDLEAVALRENLSGLSFARCLEIGCGTGKNTVWLLEKAREVTSIDLSEEMLAKAKAKTISPKVEFIQADILQDWSFVKQKYDLVSFSLMLEHIEQLDPVFEKAAAVLLPGGYVYVGELHPFKQYTGSKARFETSEGTQVVTCFTHNLSDFILSAGKYGLTPVMINEYFDDNDRSSIPRILTLLFRLGRATGF